jgi:peptidoglycan/xylan/chitin deacetylase (PgdA/CDA1 family)
MAVLRGRFSPVSLEELDAQAQAGHVRPNQVAVTIDDGYADTYRFALPLLRQYGVPFAVFPVTENIERRLPFWWDRLTRLVLRAAGGILRVSGREFDLQKGADQRARVLEAHWWLQRWLWGQEGPQRDAWLDAMGAPAGGCEDRPLTWTELQEMVDQGATVGAHTHTHPALSLIDPGAAQRELQVCMEMIRARLGRVPRFMAYPFGLFDHATPALAAAAGLDVSLTVQPGWCQAQTLPHVWPRIVVPDCSAGVFASALEVLARVDPATLDVDVLWTGRSRHLRVPVRKLRRGLRAGVRRVRRAVGWALSGAFGSRQA